MEIFFLWLLYEVCAKKMWNWNFYRPKSFFFFFLIFFFNVDINEVIIDDFI